MAVTINVTNAKQLLDVLQHATGGENIVLAPGDYGTVVLTEGKNIFSNYSSPVTITSSSVDHPAVIQGLTVNGVSNITFDHIKFDYTAAPGTVTSATPFSLNKCSNFTIANSEFNGDKASGLGAAYDGFGTGSALTVNGGSKIVVSNNEMHDFFRGVVVSKADGVKISGNDVHNMSSDGMDFAQVTNVVIDNNHIHDFFRSVSSPAHPDMIQFWTSGTTVASSNITISNNFLDIGAGQETQSIFMRNEMVDSFNAGQNMFYKNVLISNNIIRNAHSHGVTVGESTGLVIDNNTLLQSVIKDVGGNISVPTITVAPRSTAVTITDNVVPTLGSAADVSHVGWTIRNNLLATIDDPNAANYIGKLFYDALDITKATLHDFKIIKGSIIDVAHAGSQLGPSLTPSTYAGYIDAHGTSATKNTSLQQTFDASHIYTSLGPVAMNGAKVVWNFGDGKTGTGLVVNHTYATQGDYTATATITLSNGKIFQMDKTFHVQNSAILDVDFNADALDHSPTVNAVTLNTAKLVSTGDGGQALDLNGGVVKYKGNADLLNNSEFSMVIDFKKDVGEENLGGRLVYLSGSYIISVGADGITAVVNTTAGSKTLTATKLGISDSDWHRIGVSFSGETGLLKLYLDGHEVASASGLVGAIQKGTAGSDLYLGGPFGGSFGGQIDNFHLSDSAVDTLSFTTGILATSQSEFGSLAQFENLSVSQSAQNIPSADMSPSVHPVIETAPMVSLPPAHHHDFSWIH